MKKVDLGPIFEAVLRERASQDLKWEHDNIIARTSEAGFRVLGEEVGEVARAINERNRAAARYELVQVAAVAVAMIQAIDAGSPLVAPRNEATIGEHHEHKAEPRGV